MGAIDNDAELQLGAVVVQCRRRRRSAVWLDLGGSWIQLMLAPLAAAVYLTLGAFALCQYFEVSLNLTIPFTMFLFVASSIFIYALYFTAPETISLVIHERGFRYKRRLVRFSELLSIYAGKADSFFDEIFDGLAEMIGTFHRGARMAGTVRQTSKQATLTVTFKNGRSFIIKNALLEYHESDLERFFAFLRSEQSHLLTSNRSTVEITPAHSDLEQAAPEDTGSRQIRVADLTAKTPEGIDPSFGNIDVREARSELARSNYRSASLLLGATKDPHLREFYVRALQEWKGRLLVFDKWKREEPENPDAWLISGAHLISWAWEARGGEQAVNLSPEARSTFHERLRLATADLDRAAVLDMEDPAPHAVRLRACLGLNASREETVRIFEQAVRLCPDHYMAHANMLTYLCEKWHGSHEEMFSFARAVNERAAEGSLLPALIPRAHTERWLYAIDFDNDPNAENHFSQPDVRDEILAAYNHSLGSPQHLSSPLSHIPANYFAYTLERCGEIESARREYERIGAYPSLFPWGYEGDPTDVYDRHRAALFAAVSLES